MQTLVKTQDYHSLYSAFYTAGVNRAQANVQLLPCTQSSEAAERVQPNYCQEELHLEWRFENGEKYRKLISAD